MNKQFYAITLDEAIAQYQKKWISATALLYYYLRIRLAPGWKMTLHQREITEKLEERNHLKRWSPYLAIFSESSKRR